MGIGWLVTTGRKSKNESQKNTSPTIIAKRKHQKQRTLDLLPRPPKRKKATASTSSTTWWFQPIWKNIFVKSNTYSDTPRRSDRERFKTDGNHQKEKNYFHDLPISPTTLAILQFNLGKFCTNFTNLQNFWSKGSLGGLLIPLPHSPFRGKNLSRTSPTPSTVYWSPDFFQ